MVPELIQVFSSQPAGDVSHKPGDRLPLLSTRPAVTPATVNRAATNFAVCRRRAELHAQILRCVDGIGGGTVKSDWSIVVLHHFGLCRTIGF